MKKVKIKIREKGCKRHKLTCYGALMVAAQFHGSHLQELILLLRLLARQMAKILQKTQKLNEIWPKLRNSSYL